MKLTTKFILLSLQIPAGWGCCRWRHNEAFPRFDAASPSSTAAPGADAFAGFLGGVRRVRAESLGAGRANSTLPSTPGIPYGYQVE